MDFLLRSRYVGTWIGPVTSRVTPRTHEQKGYPPGHRKVAAAKSNKSEQIKNEFDGLPGLPGLPGRFWVL
jgi:hypothetical protein